MITGQMTAGDLVIVGGGLVGMTLGVAAAAAGLDVIIVDREDPTAQLDCGFDGRASAIAHGSKQVLAAIGVWPLVTETGAIEQIRVTDGPSLMHLHFDHAQVGEEPLGWLVENRHMRAALAQRAAALADRLTVVAPAGVVAVDRQGARATVTLADGRVLRAPLVVAADGRRSRLRDDAGIAVTEWGYGQTGLVCTVAHEYPHEGVAHERFLTPGPFAILPLAGNRSSIVWTERHEDAARIQALDDVRYLEELHIRFGDFLGQLRLEGPRFAYPLALTLARRFIDRRLALVGDAAHAIHPIAGQGFNLGIRDVAALVEVMVQARRLGGDVGAPDVLSRYEGWRRTDTMALVVATDGLNRLFSNDVAPVRLARDMGLAAVNRLGPVKRLAMRHAMGELGRLPALVQGRMP
ncbi:UbiH/UbiF/VisC/COQ6 family ubiquinone biosynthesis hydroxylase [Tistrella mobilis]